MGKLPAFVAIGLWEDRLTPGDAAKATLAARRGGSRRRKGWGDGGWKVGFCCRILVPSPALPFSVFGRRRRVCLSCGGEGNDEWIEKGKGTPSLGRAAVIDTLSLSPFGEGEDLRMRKCGD